MGQMTPNKIPLLGGSLKDEPWKHDRRAITTHAIDHWIGWEKILSLYRKARRIDRDLSRRQHSLYFVVIFESGGRKGEVVLLKPEQIRWDDQAIKITRMRVFKYRKTTVRNVYIKIEGNPLAQPFIEYVEACDTDYLLPGYGTRFSREIDPQSHISTTHVYNKICEIDKDIWPHFLRDQRSWQLSAKLEKGGRDFDSYELKEWFNWKSMEMPSHYAGRRSEEDIRRKLGIKDVKAVVK